MRGKNNIFYTFLAYFYRLQYFLSFGLAYRPRGPIRKTDCHLGPKGGPIRQMGLYARWAYLPDFTVCAKLSQLYTFLVHKNRENLKFMQKLILFCTFFNSFGLKCSYVILCGCIYALIVHKKDEV